MSASREQALSTSGTTANHRRVAIRWGPISLVTPPLLFFLIFYITPLMYMVLESLTTDGATGLANWTLENYQKLLGDPYYWEIIWRSFRVSLLATVTSLAMGFAVAYHMSLCSPRERRFLTLIVLLPLIVSLIIRLIGWLIILTPGGLLSVLLRDLGLPRLRVLYTETAVVIGFAYAFLPFMVLAILTSLQGIDRDLTRAA